MDAQTLVGIMDFTRVRLLGSLDAIEKSGQDTAKVLAWRPGAGRAHIAWQAMHCAATHNKYFNMFILQKPAPTEPELVKAYGGGSVPSDSAIPTLAVVRSTLEAQITPLREHTKGLNSEQLNQIVTLPNGTTRTVGESIILLAWHEAHHQGQIHLTWNLYKAAHNVG